MNNLNNLELETIVLKHKKTLYQAEKDLYVYNELLQDLLDRAPHAPIEEQPVLEKMIEAVDKKITATKLKVEVATKAINLLGN